MTIDDQNTLYVTIRGARAVMLSTGRPGLALQTDGTQPIVFELTAEIADSIRRALDAAETESRDPLRK